VGRQAQWLCDSPRRLPSVRSSGFPAIGSPRAMPHSMSLYPTSVSHLRRSLCSGIPLGSDSSQFGL